LIYIKKAIFSVYIVMIEHGSTRGGEGYYIRPTGRFSKKLFNKNQNRGSS
jgi:hypothetical protein